MARAESSTELSHDELHTNFLKACQQVATEGLSRLSESVDTNVQLCQVKLPEDRIIQLQEIVNQVNFSAHVLDRWKFGLQLPYGRGVSALFFGPSGTGKTMAAMGIANQLRVPLLKLDLSRVVSKYIGETEKNINQVFEDAESSGGAILIDEADALLGKRSEVKDAHDRYANIEVAYLLQRLESFAGLVILTTNMRQNLDSAFVRRLRFIIEFPKPSVEVREQIWRFCIPDESHVLHDSAFKHLAKRVDLTGGHIRQITLRAAFLAASTGELIHMDHIASACRAEFIKLGMPSIELDVKLDRRVA
jgi:SpoVK/Ycf46/Vps4 family AAA+-type ATPase